MNPPQARDGLPQPQRLHAMLVVLTGLSMSVLDGAIANIALPTIARELRTDPANAVWVVNAYQLAVTISLLPFASLGELRGYRRVFVAGLAVFTLGSLACALSGSLTTLVAARVLQGFGGAGIMSVNTALLRFIYPADQLGRGVGINALVGSISAAIGPSVAAGILSIASWQWLFAINVPLGVVALVFASRELPRTPLARHRIDWLSALLSAATFGALIIGIDNLRRLSMPVAFELAGAAVAGALFVWRQRMLAYPMLALELFARPVFALSVVGSICSFTAQNLICLAAVLPRSGARPIGGRDRPLDDPLADGSRFHRADRGMARRPALSGRHSGRDRFGRIEPGTGSGGIPGSARGGIANRLVDGDLRRRVRLLPVTQQPHHPGQRAARTRRQRQRHSRHRAARRADLGGGPGRPDLRAGQRRLGRRRPWRHLGPHFGGDAGSCTYPFRPENGARARHGRERRLGYSRALFVTVIRRLTWFSISLDSLQCSSCTSTTPTRTADPQRRVVALGLVGVGERKLAHRLVELSILPEVPLIAQRSPALASARASSQPHILP